MNFGAQYDVQAPKLAETLVIPVADAQTFLDAKFAMFPCFEVEGRGQDEVRPWLRHYVHGGSAPPSGRPCSLTTKWDVEKALRQEAELQIQGSSAEQTGWRDCPGVALWGVVQV